MLPSHFLGYHLPTASFADKCRAAAIAAATLLFFTVVLPYAWGLVSGPDTPQGEVTEKDELVVMSQRIQQLETVEVQLQQSNELLKFQAVQRDKKLKELQQELSAKDNGVGAVELKKEIQNQVDAAMKQQIKNLKSKDDDDDDAKDDNEHSGRSKSVQDQDPRREEAQLFRSWAWDVDVTNATGGGINCTASVACVESASQRQYLLVLEWTTNDGAEASCASLGGSLASLSTLEENSFVSAKMAEWTSKEFWIGAHYHIVSATWHWISGERFDYEAFHDHKPLRGGKGVKHCAMSNWHVDHYGMGEAEVGLWDMDYCTDVDPKLRPYVCELGATETSPSPGGYLVKAARAGSSLVSDAKSLEQGGPASPELQRLDLLHSEDMWSCEDMRVKGNNDRIHRDVERIDDCKAKCLEDVQCSVLEFDFKNCYLAYDTSLEELRGDGKLQEREGTPACEIRRPAPPPSTSASRSKAGLEPLALDAPAATTGSADPFQLDQTGQEKPAANFTDDSTAWPGAPLPASALQLEGPEFAGELARRAELLGGVDALQQGLPEPSVLALGQSGAAAAPGVLPETEEADAQAPGLLPQVEEADALAPGILPQVEEADALAPGIMPEVEEADALAPGIMPEVEQAVGGPVPGALLEAEQAGAAAPEGLATTSWDSGTYGAPAPAPMDAAAQDGYAAPRSAPSAFQTLFDLTIPKEEGAVAGLDLGDTSEELAEEPQATAPSEERASADPNEDAAEVVGEGKTSTADGENGDTLDAETSDAETSSKLEMNDQPIKKRKKNKKLKKGATADSMAARIAHQNERVSNVLNGKVNR
ncbi:hypothetical protein CYMTET_28843 [Cymbomonas tetramitiformis]|uniref:C-type lectin domain-containing protein n=1 Tax=Cymbomonas tetramitiformis TaxID=36881 RepID=A0AAE0KVI0_9CHLO|nr:hypothetical protein CYMTET_28843 [Cymbomonas tetramitiformis]